MNKIFYNNSKVPIIITITGEVVVGNDPKYSKTIRPNETLTFTIYANFIRTVELSVFMPEANAVMVLNDYDFLNHHAKFSITYSSDCQQTLPEHFKHCFAFAIIPVAIS